MDGDRARIEFSEIAVEKDSNTDEKDRGKQSEHRSTLVWLRWSLSSEVALEPS